MPTAERPEIALSRDPLPGGSTGPSGSRVVVQVQGDLLQVRARPGALVRVGGGVPVEIGPRGRRFRRSGDSWVEA